MPEPGPSFERLGASGATPGAERPEHQELRPTIAAYAVEQASRLRKTLHDEFGCTSLADFERVVRDRRVPNEALVETVSHIAQIRTAVERNEVPWPGEQEFFDRLKVLAINYAQYLKEKGYNRLDVAWISEISRDFRDEVARTLPDIPPDILRTRPYLLQRILKRLVTAFPAEGPDVPSLQWDPLGLLASIIYNRAIERVEELQRPEVEQVVNLNDRDLKRRTYTPDLLGCGFPDGKLRISGDVGSGLGWGMTGGTIDATESAAGDLAGAFMMRGVLSIRRVGHTACMRMIGGEAHFEVAGDELGQHMSDGSIVVSKKSGRLTGYGMSGGNIVAMVVGDSVGQGMRGGAIDFSGIQGARGKHRTGGTVTYRGQPMM